MHLIKICMERTVLIKYLKTLTMYRSENNFVRPSKIII